MPTRNKSKSKEKNKKGVRGRVSRLSKNTVKSNRVSSKPGKRVLVLRRSGNKKPSPDELIKRFSSFPEVNPMPIVEVDVAGKILYMNRAKR